MNILWVTNFAILFGLVFGSITDFKKREVPDYLNYFLISLGIFLGAILSIYTSNIWFLLNSLIGFGVGFIFGALMFYTGQWGGADAKMLMGIGALQGVDIKSLFLYGEIPLFFVTFLTILLAGSIYGLIYIIVLFVKDWHKIRTEWTKKLREPSSIKIRTTIFFFIAIIFLTSIFLINLFLLKIFLQLFAILLFVGMHTLFLVDVIEKVCMIKNVKIKDLTEGDWIVKEIKVGNKCVCGPKDLGITLEQIKKLKELKIKNVLVKYGVPFIPGFLIGFIIVLIFGNWLTAFL